MYEGFTNLLQVKPEYMVRLTLLIGLLLLTTNTQDNMGETVDVLVIGEALLLLYLHRRLNHCRGELWFRLEERWCLNLDLRRY